MSKKTTFGLFAVIGILLVTGYFVLERGTRPAPGPDELPATTSSGATPSVPTFSGGGAGAAAAGVTNPGGLERRMDAAPGAPLFPPENPLPSVDEVLAAETEDLALMARQLAYLVAVPALPMEDRENALAHALNLSAGQEPQIIDPLVANAEVPDALVEIVLAEALNRSLTEQADLYLSALAHRKSEAMQTLIREHLAFLTDSEDLGPDPAAWRAAVNQAKQGWAAE